MDIKLQDSANDDLKVASDGGFASECAPRALHDAIISGHEFEKI